ncbi:PAS domain S-box protein [Dyadobacter fanqingshengii]|uniref:histidine kinase n=1 Tax=Dyadobacter fanqingshengii TaxID=2906443 RepID=A0A9X1PDW5_9BACT|nr:PAS domain S-box protein [Dyadobacter fanqingshengii]MCF0041457.1 PAS domain S-box protein [Dyadobacter fanqingshengii]USJ36824.1 PAS domain S-box protein [Dyadobacter fanqingshengii]
MDKLIRILHLEDLPGDALFVKKALIKANIDFQVLVADSKEKYVTALEAFLPDLILANHSLPAFNAIEALKILKESRSDIPFIVVTAAMNEASAVNLMMQGADDYILKDRLSRLPIAITNALEKYRLKKEHDRFLNELIVSEQRYRALIEHSADGVIILNAMGRPTYVSVSVSNVLGYDPTEILDMDLYTLLHPDDIVDMGLMLEKILDSPGVTMKGHTGRMLHKDGSWRWIEATITNLLDDPAVNGIVDNFRDITERKLAQDAITASEEKYRLLFETSMDGILLTSQDGQVLEANQAACSIFQRSESEIIHVGRSGLADLDDSRLSKLLEERLRTGKANGEVSLLRKDGSRFAGEISSTVFKNAHGKANTSMIVRDISERKKAEQLLLESERRLDRATTMARVGNFEADHANNQIFWSSMIRQIHEVDPDFNPELETAMNFYKPGANRETIDKATEEIIKHQTPFDLELQIITAKGNERWVRVMCEAELVNDKHILYGSFQDIDKIKETESEVLRSYAERNVIFESIGDAFFAIDKDWVVNYWNKEAARLLERTKGEVLNRYLWDLFPLSIGSESYRQYNHAVESGQTVHFEDHYEPLNRWLEVSAYPSANGLSVFFKDITGRKLSENKLNELNNNLHQYSNELALSNKGLEQFSYMVSHNLRAPVANIIGLAGLLGDESYPSELKRDFLNGILENVKRLDEVITDLNSILQIKKEIGEKSETVNFQDLVDSIKESIQNVILKENVQVVTDFKSACELFTLKTYLYSIFHNLISNSIKYHQAGLNPFIEISSSVSDGKLTLSFKDNGMGIDLPKKRDQLFGLYKRFHHHVEGKGMGLFMVKTQVEILGGTISVFSEVNKGTEFFIEFNL